MKLADVPTTALRKPTPIDGIEFLMTKGVQVECPLVHSFTPGIYVRQIHMPAQSLISSMEHNTEHLFVVVSGVVDVISPDGSERFIGPYMGTTYPGTKRLLYNHTDVVWITIHANPDNITDPDEIVRRITVPNDNPLVDDKECPEFNKWRAELNPSTVFIDGVKTQEKLT